MSKPTVEIARLSQYNASTAAIPHTFVGPDAYGYVDELPRATSDLAVVANWLATEVVGVATIGIRWIPEQIRARSTGNVNIASGLEQGDVLNGVTLTAGDHVFLGLQADARENGLYTVPVSGPATRASFANTAAKLALIGFLVTSGTVGSGEQWMLPLQSDDINLGSTLLVFSKIGLDLGWAQPHHFRLDALSADRPVIEHPAPSWPLNNVLDVFRVSINAFPIADEVGNNALGASQAIVGAIEIGASANDVVSSGVSGYARTNGPTGQAVGVLGSAAMKANGGGAWGMNPVATNSPVTHNAPLSSGFDFSLVTAVEVNTNIMKKSGAVTPTGNAFGVYIAGASEVQPTGNFAAILVDRAGVGSYNVPWKHVLLSSDGAGSAGIALGTVATGNGQTSQPISLYGRDSGGVLHEGKIFAKVDGTLTFTQSAFGDGSGGTSLLNIQTVAGDPSFQVKSGSAANWLIQAVTSSGANRLRIYDIAGSAAEVLSIYKSGGVGIGGGVNLGAKSLSVAGALGLRAPITITGSVGISADVSSLICNGSGSITLTLPSASDQAGQILFVKTIASQSVVSASANVVPLAGGSAGTAILAATSGKWAVLQSDATNWVIIMGN